MDDCENQTVEAQKRQNDRNALGDVTLIQKAVSASSLYVIDKVLYVIVKVCDCLMYAAAGLFMNLFMNSSAETFVFALAHFSHLRKKRRLTVLSLSLVTNLSFTLVDSSYL